MLTPHLLGPCGTPIPVEYCFQTCQQTEHIYSFTHRQEEEDEELLKPKATKMVESGSRLIFIIGLLSLLSAVLSIDDKCAACTAIAEELERGLMNERPRNHLDMRHRLDSKGQRQGKVIDYRVSELRVVDRLDGLCEKMQDYTLEKTLAHKYGSKWITGTSSKPINRKLEHIQKQYPLSVEGEETEDDLSELIKKGYVKAGGVSKVLCEDLSRYCDRPSADNDDGKVMDEL